MGQEFREEHLEGAFLAIAATNDKGLNRKVSSCARERGLLVNAVDQPEDCNFIVPSVVRRGDLTIAVSTSGKSPAMARRIRERLEETFGPEYAPFLSLMGRLREALLQMGFSQGENQRFFYRVLDSGVLEAFKNGDRVRLAALLKEALPETLDIPGMLRGLLPSKGGEKERMGMP